MSRTLIRTRGTILRTWNLGEADRILEIQTDELGLVRAVARGVRKIKSKLAGHLEPFTDVELMLAEGRGDLMTVTGAKAITARAGLRTDLDRMTSASAVAELVSKLSPDRQVSRRFPGLVRDALGALNDSPEPTYTAAYFEWQLIRASGWEPQLGECVSCGVPLEAGQVSFSFQAGGTICRDCRTDDPQAVEVSVDVIKLLRLFTRRTYLEVAAVAVSEFAQTGAIRIVDSLVHHTLDREPKAKRVTRQLRT